MKQNEFIYLYKKLDEAAWYILNYIIDHKPELLEFDVDKVIMSHWQIDTSCYDNQYPSFYICYVNEHEHGDDCAIISVPIDVMFEGKHKEWVENYCK